MFCVTQPGVQLRGVSEMSSQHGAKGNLIRGANMLWSQAQATWQRHNTGPPAPPSPNHTVAASSSGPRFHTETVRRT